MSSEFDEVSLFLSSDPSNGSTQLSSDGSSFNIDLSQPIDMRKYKGKLQLACISATVPFTYVNISATLGNNLIVYESNSIQYPITIDNGIYSLDTLNIYLQDELQSLPVPPTQDATLLPYFSGVISTGHVYLVLPPFVNPWSVLWGSSTLGPTLGFTVASTDVGSATDTTYYLSNDASTLGNINQAYLSLSIAKGNYFGGKANSNIVCSIPVGFTGVGQLIAYDPQQLSWSYCNSDFIQNIYVQLLQKNGKQLDLGELNYYNVTILIRMYHK